jgi:hypothetical protein
VRARELEPRRNWLAEVFRGDELRALARDAFAVEEHGIDVWSGLAGAIATAAPVAVGVAAGNRGAGLAAGIGGLNTALGVPRAGLRARMWWGSVGAIGGCGAVAVTSLVSGHAWLLALATAAWVGIWALLRAARTSGAIVGFSIAAVFVIIGGLPHGEPPLGSRVLWFAVGAAAGLALMVAARRGPPPPEHLMRRTIDDVRRGALHDGELRMHAVRLGLAVGVATLLERALRMPHGYWVPLTVLAILQPDPRATEIRCLQRAAGTLVGVAIVLVVTAITGEAWVLVPCIAVTSLGLFALDERGYFWLVVMLTPTALLMLSIVDFQGFEEGVQRTLNSGLGIVIGLVFAETIVRIGRPARAPSHR